MIINPKDNVEIRDDGHKYALRDITEGENELSGAQGIAIFKDGVAP